MAALLELTVDLKFFRLLSVCCILILLKTKKLSSLSLRRRSQIHRSLSTHACFCMIAREVLYEYLEVDGFGKGSTKRYGKLEDELENWADT